MGQRTLVITGCRAGAGAAAAHAADLGRQPLVLLPEPRHQALRLLQPPGDLLLRVAYTWET